MKKRWEKMGNLRKISSIFENIVFLPRKILNDEDRANSKIES